MEINSELKPLYANLKRQRIGEFLYTRDFELFMLEHNFDKFWKICKREVSNKKRVMMLGYHNTEEEEEAFMDMLNQLIDKRTDLFEWLILETLLGFAKWNPIKIDFTTLIKNLSELKINSVKLIDFELQYKIIQNDKPDKLEQINLVSNPTNKKNNKVFVVHGHDDAARLEVCKLLKDDFNLEPIVLQENPNKSIETIFSKFERLADECSMAIILFTPDDLTAENLLRARQNVILELGYFRIGLFFR